MFLEHGYYEPSSAYANNTIRANVRYVRYPTDKRVWYRENIGLNRLYKGRYILNVHKTRDRVNFLAVGENCRRRTSYPETSSTDTRQRTANARIYRISGKLQRIYARLRIASTLKMYRLKRYNVIGHRTEQDIDEEYSLIPVIRSNRVEDYILPAIIVCV